jgi:hypothetical protein
MAKGLFLVGGGEDLALNREIPVRSLQGMIKKRAEYLVETIDAFLRAFIIEAGKEG